MSKSEYISESLSLALVQSLCSTCSQSVTRPLVSIISRLKAELAVLNLRNGELRWYQFKEKCQLQYAIGRVSTQLQSWLNRVKDYICWKLPEPDLGLNHQGESYAN